jgi:ribosomal protein L36
MKVRASVKKLCDACRAVKRRGKVYIVCKENRKVRLRLLLQLNDGGELMFGVGPTGARHVRTLTHRLSIGLPLVQHKQRQGYHTEAGPSSDVATPVPSFMERTASIGVRLWQQTFKQ